MLLVDERLQLARWVFQVVGFVPALGFWNDFVVMLLKLCGFGDEVGDTTYMGTAIVKL